MSAALLTCSGLRVAVAGRTLVRDLDLALHAGEMWAILGLNGSGKSSLLHTLAGLQPAAAGTVHLDGRPLQHWRRRQIAQRLGLVAQSFADPFPATVLETALIGRHPHLRPWQGEGPRDHAAAHAALAQMELDALAGREVATLSGGERRRLGLATLLTQAPPLMLLDEPTNDLDLHHQVQVIAHFRALADAGRGVAAVLHDVNLAARFAHRALLLFADGTWLSGATAQVLTAAHLGRLFRHPVQCVDGPHGPLFVPD